MIVAPPCELCAHHIIGTFRRPPSPHDYNLVCHYLALFSLLRQHAYIDAAN